MAEFTLDVTGPIRGLGLVANSARKLHELLKQTGEDGTHAF
ncbi:hypothetical protein [Hymenobacter sp. GOD-10R]|nr:hypothetical protein [Hymenobacter sp. GOD-10R]WRQ31797.1 hypothetical protein SD425_28530 [Hymenobacter sp. GOD-10R]